LACPALLYLPRLFHKWHAFEKKNTEHTIGVLIFPTTLFEAFLILRGFERDAIKIQISVYVHYLVFLPDFVEYFIFSIDFRKKLRYENIKVKYKNPPRGSFSTQTDVQIDIKKLVVAFRNFINAQIISQLAVETNMIQLHFAPSCLYRRHR
jgi:hypothetical protein